MRILLLVVYYPPIPNAAGFLMRDLAKEYVSRGHQVIVVTPSSSIHEKTMLVDEEGITVIRVRSAEMKDTNRFFRLWREIRLSGDIWRRASDLFKSAPCDLVVFYSPTIFFGKLVERLRKLWDCQSYLILRDIFPQWAVDAGLLHKRGILYRFLRRKELEQYQAANVIGVQSKGDLAYFENNLLHKLQVELLYNWVNEASKPSVGSHWRKKLGLEGKVIFCYGGNIGVAQDMDNIVRLAANLRHRDDCFFLLIGQGTEVRRIRASISRLALENIRVLPSMGESAYLQCLSECDVGLVTLDRRLRSHNFPGKLLGYMLCGVPILASINSGNDLKDVLEEAGAGICCVNGEDEKLCKAAQMLASQPLLRERMGRNANLLSRTTFSAGAAANQILLHWVPTSGIGKASPAPGAPAGICMHLKSE
jgi:O26-antigen biosynthesis N-acetyl-L-fucosamine transferase